LTGWYNGPQITLITLITQITLIYLLYLIYQSLSLFSSIILSHIHLLSLYLFLSLTYSSFPHPASFPAGRIPSCGGIARPKGKHSRRMAVFCLPAADSRQESGIDSQRDENPAGFRPPQGHSTDYTHHNK
jgi:hypothetical protein